MSHETLGLIGGIFGGLMGILGGVVGTYFSIKSTKGPRERAFMVRASIYAWMGIIGFLLGLLLLPSPYRFGLIPLFLVVQIGGIRYLNGRIAVIQEEEKGGHRDGPAPEQAA